MAKPKDVLLDHEVDGIKEYDNPLPAWWLGIFYVTIAFAIVFIPYLYITGWTSIGQYEEEMAAAEAEYVRGLDAEKRGAPKSAQRFFVRALRNGLKGPKAVDAQRRIRRIADKIALEASEF